MSLETIAGAIIPAAVIASAYIIAFLAIRGKYRSQYAPRTFNKIIPEKDRTPSTSASGAAWFQDYRKLDDTFVLRHHSFDAFLFLRFFRTLILIAAVGCLLTWPILFPLNATGGGSAQQLDILAFGNVAKASHCWGHAVVAIVFLTFIMLLVNRERVFLINMRQTYMTTSANAQRLSSRVVLFLSVPEDVVSNGHFERIFGENVKRTWKIAKLDDLKSLVDDRTQKVYDLEAAEVKLEQNVAGKQRKSSRNGQTNESSLESGDSTVVSNPQVRPTHRSPPLVGQKLDSLDHILSAIPDLTKQIAEIRDKYSTNEDRRTSAIFVEFKDQLHAHQALQQVQHHNPLALQPRFIGIPPSNIKWAGLTLDPALRISYGYMAIALIIAITIFWSIPVSFVGTISNIHYLSNIKWLHWLEDLPDSVIGLIQGFVPPFLLSLLTSYVPFWFRDIAELSGEPTAQSAEAMTQRWYFTFQFLQVFLVATLSSGAATIVRRIGERPGDIPTFLADNLPKSSNFYLTYFTLQGLSTAASQLIKYSDTFEYIFWKKIATTPREKYDLETKMKGLFYGNQYPKFTNMAVIAIVYSCIAPLVLGFALAGFTLFYATYRYLMLYTNNAKLEMKGTAHARALQQLLTGVYVAELCLIGLFGARNAKGPSILMTVFFILTIIQHLTVNKYLVPLETYMPLDVLESSDSESNDVEANVPNEDEEATPSEPLLSSSESRDARLSHPKHKHKPSITQTIPYLLDPLKPILTRFNILPSARVLRPFLLPTSDLTSADGDLNTDLRDSTQTTVPSYTESQIANAYLHPALTNKTPLVWIPRDQNGVSEELKGRNRERADLETSDEGAELDEKGRLHWDEDDLSKAPIYKLPTRF